MITLLSGDNISVPVSRSVAMQSGVIKAMLEDECDFAARATDATTTTTPPPDAATTTPPAIPLPNVAGATLAKVVEYCQHHEHDAIVVADAPTTVAATTTPAAPPPLATISPWDAAFFSVTHDELFALIMAANYLDIKPLVHLIARTIANTIKGKTVEQIRTEYAIVNDLTPAEEEAIKKENEWCY